MTLGQQGTIKTYSVAVNPNKYNCHHLENVCPKLLIQENSKNQDMVHQNKTQTVVKTASIDVKVTGVGCSSDLKTIQTNIEKIKGVSKCEVKKTGSTSVFRVTYDPKKATEQDIHSAIENTGGCKDPNEKPYKVKKK